MFRFTLRDFLWLTLVIAMALGCCVDRAYTARRHRGEKEAILDEMALMLHEMTKHVGTARKASSTSTTAPLHHELR